MKLAEALILRADLQKRHAQLKARIIRSAKVQEGETPPEDPARLLAEAEQVATQLEDLLRRINRTNSTTPLDDGSTLTDALARRDVSRLRHALLREVAQAAVVTQDRYSKSEVRFRSTVAIAAIEAQADDLARSMRELEARIQEANWRADLA